MAAYNLRLVMHLTAFKGGWMRQNVVLLMLVGVIVVGAAPAQAATVTVETQDNKFVPADIKAKAGDTISFKNTGQVPHNAVTADGSIKIPLINPGEEKTATVGQGGTLELICEFHRTLGMTGTITVEGGAGAPPPPAQGGAPPSPPPPPAPAAGAGQPPPPPPPPPSPPPEEKGGEKGGEGEEPVAAPPTQKYLPPVGILLALMMLGLIGLPFRQYLMPVLASTFSFGRRSTPAPAPGAALATATAEAPARPKAAAPAAAPEAPAKQEPSAEAAPAPPAEPRIDPKKVYEAVLNDELESGTDRRVAEARAKAAEIRTRESAETVPPSVAVIPAAAPEVEPSSEAEAPPAEKEASRAEAKAPAAEAPAKEAPPKEAPAQEAPAEEAPAKESPAKEAPAQQAPAEASAPAASDEEAAEIRQKVYDEEIGKGSDPRVAEGRAKAAELRAKRGTKGPQ